MIGRTVTHISYGNGKITSVESDKVTVCFKSGEKKFIYPEAFSRFLVFTDAAEQRDVGELIAKKEQIRKKQLRAAQREWARRSRMNDFRVLSSSQAAFSVKEPQALETWQVSTGIYSSGATKGENRRPEKLKPNSACLVTLRPQGAQEPGRLIIGAFMVEPDFFGEDCAEGCVCAHEKYRIALEGAERLPFWEYFSDIKKPRWGNTAFKYFSNLTMLKILADMQEACGMEKQKELDAFLQYFRKMNRMRPEPEDSVYRSAAAGQSIG